MAEKKEKKKQDSARCKEGNAEFRKEAGSAFTDGGNAAYQPRDANTGKPGHGAAGKRRAEKSMQAHQETFGQKVQKLRNGVLYVLWNGQNKTPGTAYRQTECTGCPQGSPKGFPCPYFSIQGREFTYQSSFFIKKSNSIRLD